MAYSGSDLTTEIRALIDSKIERNGVVDPAWITMEICGAHKQIKGEDSEFHFFCASQFVRDSVGKALKFYDCKLSTKGDPQLVLPGYEHLQRAYLVKRKDKPVIVAIDDLTDEELEAKEAELLAMSEGAKKHANELRRYRLKRRKAA